MVAFVSLLLFICVALPLAFYNGVVVADAWNWFVKDSFGMPALSSLQGWGIMLFISSTQIFNLTLKIMKEKTDNPDKKKKNDPADELGKAVLLYFSYFFGLLFVHGYMWLLHNTFW